MRCGRHLCRRAILPGFECEAEQRQGVGSVGCSSCLGFPSRSRCPHEVRHGVSRVAAGALLRAGDELWEVGPGLSWRPRAGASRHAASGPGLTAPGSEGSLRLGLTRASAAPAPSPPAPRWLAAPPPFAPQASADWSHPRVRSRRAGAHSANGVGRRGLIWLSGSGPWVGRRLSGPSVSTTVDLGLGVLPG